MSHRLSIALTLALAVGPIASAAAQPASDAEDLDSAALDPGSLDTGSLDTPQPRKLEIYGFTDFTLRRLFMPNDSAWQARLNKESSFAVGKLNLYLRSQPAPRFTSLAEVRFLYGPHSVLEQVSPGVFEHVDNTINDYSDIGATITWGGISIERAWLQYDAHRLLSVRAGHWLTPYGLWNIDHGSPTVIGVRRPFILLINMFPESQTGVQLLGATQVGSHRLSYHLTVANNAGPSSNVYDHHDSKLLGGRLQLEVDGPAQLQLGVSGYAGRETKKRLQISASDPTDINTTEATHQTLSDADVQGAAADVRLRWKRLGLDAEFISRRIKYRDPYRPQAMLRPGGFVPNGVSWGGYLLASYRQGPWGMMPYGSIEHLRDKFSQIKVTALTGGVNFRPAPTVVLKLGYSSARVSAFGATPTYPLHTLRTLEAQVAWVFR